MISLPLLNEGHKIEFYISTFSSPIESTLLNITSKNKIVISPIEKFNEKNYQQKDMIVKGLNIIPRNKFDVILIMRFDLIYKKKITTWLNLMENFEVVLLWKLDKTLANKCISDTFYAVNSKCINAFKCNVSEAKDQGMELHHLIKNSRMKLSYKFCFDNEYYDTNTSHDNNCSNNPVYIQHNRPYYHNDVEISNLLNPISLM
jgi:hypothetical protein